MKKTILSLIAIIIFGMGLNAQDVNIPDANFKQSLVVNASINTSGDSEIQVSEASAFTGLINCAFISITDLTGIEAFTSLTGLDCNNNLLTSLDVTQNTALTSLICRNNNLTALDVSQNTALTNLICSSNPITSLNTSGVTTLDVLDCTFNNLTNLSLSTNTNLTSLKCSGNSLAALDVSNNTALTYLECAENAIASLDISNNTSLTFLECFVNSISSLDVSNNTSLSELHCGENSLTTLDLSNNVSLTIFSCYDNSLTSLNVANGNNTIITSFSAHTNPNLVCINVDDAAYSTTNWTDIDAASSFSENCGVGINQLNATMINIHPNPASDQITIDSEDVIEGIAIFNMFGELVQQEASATFSVAALPNGGYVMNIQTSNGIVRSRFVKK
ncbi:MAG: T9SS type A sorting domain-containing protein [Flavobacteriales bacterium]|nr:T9SS type A sorting domain-containing protein [Flavobacteriales bacterium]